MRPFCTRTHTIRTHYFVTLVNKSHGHHGYVYSHSHSHNSKFYLRHRVVLMQYHFVILQQWMLTHCKRTSDLGNVHAVNAVICF